MGFFRRLWDLIRGRAHATLERMEDPEATLSLAIKDVSAEVEDFRQQVARALVDQKRLQADVDASVARVNDWGDRARAAVDAEDDDLAREALVRRSEEEALARQKYAALTAQSQAVLQLKDRLRELTQKLEDAKRRRTLLVARARKAQAQKKMAEALGGSGGGAFERFAALEARVETMEAEAATAVEMLHEFDGGGRDLEGRFKALAIHAPSIDSELAALKAKRLGEGKTPKLLSQGPILDDPRRDPRGGR